jgi:hypothetical protein
MAINFSRQKVSKQIMHNNLSGPDKKTLRVKDKREMKDPGLNKGKLTNLNAKIQLLVERKTLLAYV